LLRREYDTALRYHVPVTRALLLVLLLAASPASAQDAARKGPPAFVPLESPEAGAALRAAAALVREGRIDDAVDAYQVVIDGPLALRLAAAEGGRAHRDTLEQSRERAQRELSLAPALLAAHRKRFEPNAAGLLDAALAAGDARGIRETFARFPLTVAGGRAGALLARAAHRRGDSGECLGILDRLRDLYADAAPAGTTLPDLLALQATAAAATGDLDLLDRVEREARALGAAALAAPVAGRSLQEHVDEARRAAAPALPVGPRGPLVLRWQWMPAPVDSPYEDPEQALPPAYQGDFPAAADHSVAVSGGRVYWTDRLRVTCLDLDTGATRAVSVPVSAGRTDAAPGREHRGDFFAPAAADGRLVAPLDLPDGAQSGRRAGTLNLFDENLRLLARRGGVGDLEHPEFARRFVFHGRPLLAGDCVYVSATETPADGDHAAGDVRTHVLAFRRADLEPLWDTFLAYGSGIHDADVAPPGSPALRHGRLYLATHTGLEACLEARTGAVLWARRYRTPELPPVLRLGNTPDLTMSPVLWHDCPPAFSGELVAFAPRDSYSIDFLSQRPMRRPRSSESPEVDDNGRVLGLEHPRPRLDSAAMTALWVLSGPEGRFFLAGQSAGPEEPPLHLRDLRESVAEAVPWRGPVMESTVVGLPARTADAVYVATEKAIYRVPYPGGDGDVERLAAIPPRDPEKPRPSPGNLVVLPDRVLSVSDDGILCWGPAR
jgi:hypothetical protein